MKVVRIPHEIVIYEESIDELVKREIARFSFFTAEYVERPPDEMCNIIVEVK